MVQNHFQGCQIIADVFFGTDIEIVLAVGKTTDVRITLVDENRNLPVLFPCGGYARRSEFFDSKTHVIAP
jgi:hypothetical protein